MDDEVLVTSGRCVGWMVMWFHKASHCRSCRSYQSRYLFLSQSFTCEHVFSGTLVISRTPVSIFSLVLEVLLILTD